MPQTKSAQTRRKLLQAALQSALFSSLFPARFSLAQSQSSSYQTDSLKRPTMTYDTSTWKPFCFGRLMMLLPPEAVTTIRCKLSRDEIKLRTDLSSMALLTQEVKARQDEFKSQTHKEFGNRYIGTYDLNGHGFSVFGYNDDEINPINKKHYRRTHNYFFTQIPFRVWCITEEGVHTPDTRKVVVDAYTQLAAQIRPLADGEVPKEFGCVIEKGIIRSDTWEAEGMDCSFRLPWFTNPVDNYPLVTFAMESLAQGVADTEDDEIVKKASSGFESIFRGLSGFKMLRKAYTTINGLALQQVLISGPDEGKAPGWRTYQFLLRGMGKAKDNYAPNIEIRMKGRLPESHKKPAPPFANDEAAVAFWDAVVGTLRLRPVLAADGRTITDSGAVELPPTCQSEGLVPRTGVYEAQIDASHPSASYFNEGPLRWAYKQEGERMNRLGAYGAEHLVTWTWIRKNWEV
ncbi:T6SS immunity protein Tli4 family protein [Undibacterium curvum]|uniref:T6SS immunity protein Tli4 family protein n=1 Tax=Undibacterium curvum TaxID=2762294 RepID=UPI003D12BF2D